MATVAAALAERQRIMSGGRGLVARLVWDANHDIYVKDSRTTPENESVAEGNASSAWGRYEVGTSDTYPDSTSVFT